MIQHQIIRHLADVGIDVAGPIAETEALRLALVAEAAPPIDLRADLAAGKLTSTNAAKRLAAAAQAVAIGRAMTELRRGLAGPIATAMSRAIRDCAPAILDALRPKFDEAVVDLALSVERLGPRPDRKVILAAGPAAVTAWHERTTALASMSAVRSLRMDLARSGWGPANQSAAWYVGAVTDQADLDRAERAFAESAFEGLISAGFRLYLNAPPEIASIVAAAAEATSLEEAAVRQATNAERSRLDRREADAWSRLAGKAKPPGRGALDAELAAKQVRRSTAERR